MAAALGVGGGVPVGRVVAAADLAALEADPEMKPLAARGEAVLAALDGVGQFSDQNVVEMSAGGHGFIFCSTRLSCDPPSGLVAREP